MTNSVEESSTKHRGLLIFGLLVAMLFSSLDNTIVGTVMPRIVGELGGLGVMTWLTTAYMLCSTTMVPIAGKLADLIGRKTIYMAGLIIFIAGSALCGVAQTMGELIIFRGIQGIGGGIMMPMAMIVIGDIFTGEQRAKWQGVFGGVFGLSSIIGPQVGGWIVDSLNWRWVFYINLPTGILATILIALGLKNVSSNRKVKIDVWGMVTMVIAVVSLLLGMTFGGKEYAWGSWQIISLFVVALLSLILFIRIENRVEEPLLPLRLFRSRVFSLMSGIGFFMSIGMFGAIMFVPFFMQGVVGISASDSGTVMLPMMLSMMVASILGGRLVRKIGFKKQIMGGMLIMAVGFVLLSSMDISTTKGIAMIYMVVLGLGLGLTMPLITLALQESFPKSELGVVTSSTQFFRQIGGTFGMTLMGAVMNHQSSKLLTDNLVPVIDKLPKEPGAIHQMVTQMEDMVQTNPQGLFSMMFSPEALEKVPTSMQQMMMPILKTSLVDTLQPVFLCGVAFVAIGFVLSVFLKPIVFSTTKAEDKERKSNTISESESVA